MRTFLFVLAFAILVLAIGLKVTNKANLDKKNSESPPVATVTVENNRFMPTLTNINKNQSVIFKNIDTQAYNLVPNLPGAPVIGTLSPNQTRVIVFNSTGFYKYQDATNADVYVTINVD